MDTAYQSVKECLKWFYYKALQNLNNNVYARYEVWMELTPAGREKCNMLTCSLKNSGFTDSILCCSCTCITHYLSGSCWSNYPSWFIS